MDAIAALRRYLSQELRVAQAETLDPDLPLVQRGIVDSIELMQMVEFLEREFGIRVEETEVLPANLRSLSAMAAFVARKQAAARG